MRALFFYFLVVIGSDAWFMPRSDVTRFFKSRVANPPIIRILQPKKDTGPTENTGTEIEQKPLVGPAMEQKPVVDTVSYLQFPKKHRQTMKNVQKILDDKKLNPGLYHFRVSRSEEKGTSD